MVGLLPCDLKVTSSNIENNLSVREGKATYICLHSTKWEPCASGYYDDGHFIL